VVVNAVRRNSLPVSKVVNQPAGDMVLHAGDVLMLLGQQEALAEAEKRLRIG